ncbi:sulfatase-like hydrolase/transferase [Xenophilus sp.]|uniref:sulfatase-like hydrolase/transferase n=1 Tax=Xenophilus sp. TaxID=1873499 RepID=UPI0037DCBB04
MSMSTSGDVRLSHVITTALARPLALTLPMVPGLLAAAWLQVYRPWFWAEFLLIAVLSRGRPALFALGLALTWMADFLFVFAQVNLSSNYGEVLDLLSFVPYTNVGWIVAGAAGAVGLVLWGWLCLRLQRRASTGRGLLLWALVLLAVSLAWPRINGFDLAEGKLYGIRGVKLAGSWVLTSQQMRSGLSFYEEGFAPDAGKFVELPKDGSAVRRMLARAAPAEKMLVVVVESWGLSRSAAENQFWKDLWASSGWQVRAGTLPFQGATVAGELRELCGFVPASLRIDAIPDAQRCLPNRLRAQGWRTQAFHGASGKMYRRDAWYPVIGFDRSSFMQQLIGHAKRCSSIPGVCDYSIASQVVQTLRQEGRQFTYWMTLNSHTPYRESDLSDPLLLKQVCAPLGLQDARCRHAALLYDFMQSLKAALSQQPIQRLQVVLVGDHAPKFFDAHAREDFDDTAVPYLMVETPAAP